MINIISARVAQKNTAETDCMQLVNHIVCGQKDGKEVTTYLMASDPMEALQLARSLPENAWS
jgi:hypothetical protein